MLCGKAASSNQKSVIHGLCKQTGWWLFWRDSNWGICGGICAPHATKFGLSCCVLALATGQPRTAGLGCAALHCLSQDMRGAQVATPVLNITEKALSEKREVKRGPTRCIPLLHLQKYHCFSGCFLLDRQPCALGTEGRESQSRGQPIFRLTISHSLAGWVVSQDRARLSAVQPLEQEGNGDLSRRPGGWEGPSAGLVGQ